MQKLLVLGVFALSLAASGRANSSVYLPLALPKANNIAAFSNGLPPATGSRRPLTKTQVLRFLKRGRNNTDPATWPPGGEDSDHPCDGVMVDRAGQVYFWTLASRRGLRLETADGRTAYLEFR